MIPKKAIASFVVALSAMVFLPAQTALAVQPGCEEANLVGSFDPSVRNATQSGLVTTVVRQNVNQQLWDQRGTAPGVGLVWSVSLNANCTVSAKTGL
jgi:hypothetical protein